MTTGNLAQMAFILRAKQSRKAGLERQVKDALAELAEIERQYAIAAGLPTLRGERLLAALDDELALAKRREKVA